jgi:hypothetical protein
MKKFLVVIIFAFTFISCDGTPPIVSSACEITNQICFYAQAICNAISSKNISEAQKQIKIKELQSIADNMKSFYDKSTLSKSSNTSIRSDQAKEQLNDALNNLKSIAIELQVYSK